ncbi:hypothetical protein KKA14_15430, partial [bacterium]|nr:hypothetical protein [bacterium]
MTFFRNDSGLAKENRLLPTFIPIIIGMRRIPINKSVFNVIKPCAIQRKDARRSVPKKKTMSEALDV